MGTLRIASESHADFIRELWMQPENTIFLNPFDEHELIESILSKNILLWECDEEASGFIALECWAPGNVGLSDLAVVNRNSGVGVEMLTATINRLFSDPLMHRLSLDTTIDNMAAIKLSERTGFFREGVLRECWQRPNSEWIDCVLYGLLRREWKIQSESNSG